MITMICVNGSIIIIIIIQIIQIATFLYFVRMSGTYSTQRVNMKTSNIRVGKPEGKRPDF
jgi:hypothetical protein